MDPTQRREKMAAVFRERFGSQPERWVRAPGRVDLMGSHTDYNEGYVLTLSIDRETWIAARPRDDGQIRIASLNVDASHTFPADDPGRRVTDWGLYVQGVAIVLRQAGYPIRGFDGLVHGTVPLGGGLSSSASLESAAATLFEQLGDYGLDPVEKAKLCQKAENEIVGVNCGILDQYSAILGEAGRALLLDCRTLTHSYADFPEGLQAVICNTCAPRELSGSEYGERRAHCEEAAAFFAQRFPAVKTLRDVSLASFARHEKELSATVSRRARFILEENARVLSMAEALSRDDREAIGRLCVASFAGARDLFEISVPAMEAMMRAMQSAPGTIGARQAGAGFGGCMVAFVEQDSVGEFCCCVERSYQAESGIRPEIYPVHTAAGASALGRTDP
jgi:galactokinase